MSSGFFGVSSQSTLQGEGQKFIGFTVKSSQKVWTKVPTGFESSVLSGIGYLNGNWLIGVSPSAGSNPSIITSPDLVTWTQKILSNTITGHNSFMGPQSFGAGVYCVTVRQVGGNNFYATSSDLTTWTIGNSTMNAAASTVNPVCFGNSVFVGSDNNSGAYETSPDGVTWTARSTYVPLQWFFMVFDGTKFVATVKNASGNNMLVTSTDGITWTEQGAALTAGSTSVMNNGTSLYVMGNSTTDSGESRPAPSSAGTAFSFNDAGHGNLSQGLAVGGGSWARVTGQAIVGDSAQSSSTGNSGWAEDATPVVNGGGRPNQVAFGNNTFVAVGDAGSGANRSLVMKRAP